MPCRLGFFVLLCLICVPQATRGQPVLSHALPGAAQPGQTTEITLHGSKLDGDLKLWCSIPAKLELLPVEADKKDVKSRVCKVSLDASVPVGIGGIIAGSAEGNSEVLFFMADDLPSVADNGDNHTLDKSQSITLPAAVDGASNGAVSDFYKFAAKKDQRISVEVVAARLARAYDAVLRLLDASGRELMLADDDASFGADGRFAYTVPADGDYVLEVRDNQYRSGGRYRLRLGDFPLVSAPYPMGGRFGSTMRFQFAGPLSESALPVYLRVPDEVPLDRLSVAAKFPSGKSSGMATIVASRLPDVVEFEPNDDFGSATLTSLPCAVNGAFQRAGDVDCFAFAATKGQVMHFRAVSRSMGSPSYLLMRLHNSEGAQLVESPINDADESSFTYTFPADGMYRLLVKDLLARGGPEFAYRVEVDAGSGFSLTLKHDNTTKTRFALPRNGGACGLTLQIARRGYEGPIRLSLASAPSGFTLYDDLVPEKAKEHRVLIAVPPTAEPGSLYTLRMVGTASVDGREIRSFAHTGPTLRAQLPQLAFPPSWLDGMIAVSVRADSPPVLALTSSASPVAFARSQGQAQFTVKLERKNADFKEPATLKVCGLPERFTAAVKAEKDTYQVTITGPKDAANGRSEIELLAYAEFKGTGQLVKVPVPLEVTD